MEDSSSDEKEADNKKYNYQFNLSDLYDHIGAPMQIPEKAVTISGIQTAFALKFT